jgi:2'-5' RNA ligase
MSTIRLTGGAASLALVAYIPGALGAFIDSLSDSLPGERRGRAHLTLLPPRPLTVSPYKASKLISGALADIPPFEVELTKIVRFPSTNVIYIALGAGFHEAYRAHNALNQGPFHYPEPFDYHPHITISVPEEGANPDSLERLAAEAWAGFNGARRFTVDALDFLQQCGTDEWEKLCQIELSAAA